MHEIETKILEINEEDIIQKLEKLGAQKIEENTLVVDWFSLPNVPKGQQPYYLRIRSYSNGKVEVTWKGPYKVIGNSHQGKEINVLVDNHEKMRMIFESLGFVVYAHQEKKRMSWKLNNVQFDLDTYPNVPPYLEIEAGSEEEINDLIGKLDLKNYESWNNGERILIEEKYKLDWYNMHF